MDWLNNNALPVWSASANSLSTANSNLAASNLALSNLASNLPNKSLETGSLAANLPGQSNGNQLGLTTPSGEFATSLAGNPSLYSSLLSQNYLIPFLKNAALLANLTSNAGSANGATPNGGSVNSVNSSSLSDDQWTGRNAESGNQRSINALDSKVKKERCRGR